MKKRLISMALTLSMLLSIGSYVTAQESPDSAPAVESTPVVEAVPYHRDGDVPAMSRPMDGVIPPITALVMCMLEKDLSYNQNDDTLLWNGLYYMLSLYGQMDSRAEMTDEKLILPTEAVQDYAAALFNNMEELPQIPDTLASQVTYRDGLYYLGRGDAGQMDIQLGNITTQPDGALIVEGSLVSTMDDSVRCTFLVKLQSNDSMFGYAIQDVLIQH